MRESLKWVTIGSASGLVFASFAVIAGLLVEWPAGEIFTISFAAFCGGAALEHLLRRHYGLAWVFIGGVVLLVGVSMRPSLKLSSAITAGVSSDVGPGPLPAGAAPARDTRKSDEKRPSVVVDEPKPNEVPTTILVHNPSAVPVSITYQYPGGSVALGGVGAAASGTFSIPNPAPLQLATFIARSGDRSVSTYVWLRRGRANEVELPRID